MAFSFNAALINDELNVNKEHSKINKESLNKLLTSNPQPSKEKPSSIDVANIHANLKEENEEELNNFYEKETKPPVVHAEPSRDLKGANHFMLLGDQRMEQYKPPKDNLLQKVNHILWDQYWLFLNNKPLLNPQLSPFLAPQKHPYYAQQL